MSEDTNNTPVQDELTTLKARADLVGLKYHPSIGVDALREKLAEKLRDDSGAGPAQGAAQGTATAVPQGSAPAAASVGTPAAPVTPAPAEAKVLPKEVVPVEETLNAKRIRLKKAAMKLVRIRVTCMNPNKAEWDGEFFSVGNATVPTVTKYLPFHADEGWHVPQIILDQIKARKCQIFVNKKDEMGRTTRTGKMISEFAIEIMDPLTEDELAELAARQAATRAID